MGNGASAITAIKLHTVKDLIAMFPSGTLTEAAANKLLEGFGTYRKIGASKFLTDRDVTDFIERVSARRTNPPEPRYEEAGQVVFIGNPAANSEDELVWIGWCPIDQELDLLDRVRLGVQEHVMILANDNASYGDVTKLKAKLKSARAKGNPYGNWFHRADLVMSEVMKINGTNSEGDED